MDKPTYSWSHDEEVYHGEFGSIDDAIQAAFEREARNVDAGERRHGVHIGENEPFDTATYVGAEAFIDWARERVFEELGEASENFLGTVTAEQQQELDAFLRSWVGRVDYGSHYWTIKNSTFHRFADYGLSQDAE